jgi:predicted ATPase
LLLEQGIPPEASYRFRHALIQDAAYQSLLRSKRQGYHWRIAQVLEERFPEIAEAQPQLLAYHYSEAGLGQQAIPHWQMAGQKAVQRSANAEAVSHLTKGLELLKTLPETLERFQQELAVQLALGTPLIATQGFGSPEVGKVYARARELCQRAGEAPQLFPVVWGLWMFYMARAQHIVARELAEQCLRLAQSARDTSFLVQAHHVQGVGLIGAGDFTQARQHLEQAIDIYDPRQHASHAYIYGHDPAAVSRVHASWSLWFLGYPDQALKRVAEGLALAQRLSHPYTSATANAFAAWLHQFCRNGQAVEELASAALTISTEHDFAFYRAMGIIMRGWALTQRAQVSDGIAEMRTGLDAYRVTGAEVLRPGYLSLLAEACGDVGHAEEGLGVLAEAQALAVKCREHWWQAELYRLKGELTLKRPSAPSSRRNVENEAEDYFGQALAVAKAQKAKSLELRAAMSLFRLRAGQSKSAEARRMLEETFAFFTEGFDTADLLEAKALLEQ